MLNMLGFDRAADLLKNGDFQSVLDSTIDDASYIGLAIKCLKQVEIEAGDSITVYTVTAIREALESERQNKLFSAFDIIDSSKNAAMLEAKNYIQDAQSNIKKVKGIITQLKGLAAKAGDTYSALETAYDGVEGALGEIFTGPGGAFNGDISDLNVDGFQSGCPNLSEI